MKSETEKSGRFLIIAICFLLLISTAQGAWDNDDLMYAKGTSGGQSRVHNNDTAENFETIQDAIDDPDTKDGHNISVDAGIYRERVLINKQLKLIGENKDNTTIDAYGSGNCIQVTADNVEIRGFTIKNGNYGIYLESSNCSVTDNNIASIDFDGIFLRSNSVNNTIAHNSISEVKGKGIRLSSSCNNRIDGNDLSENGKGISLSSSHNNTFCHNRLTDNSNCGICLSSSNNNSIQDNDLSGSEEGIFLLGCNKNYIYHNNFIENRIQASDSSDTNRWDNGSIDGGNYWSDHKCTGNPSDGNQPYIISGGIMGATDFYPFMDEDGWLANLTVAILYPNGGESIPVGTQVPVSVHATDDTAVTNVNFSYSSNGGSTWNIIEAGIRVSGTDKDGIWNGTWNTNGLSVGSNYMIKAVASDGTLTIEDLSESAFSLSCTLPSPPTLTDPGTNDTDGNYTVSWSKVSNATNYTLEEDTNSSFSSPTTVYFGSGTSKEITGKSDGTYYYQVKARNECGWSDWSNKENITIDSVPPTVTITYPTSEQMFNTTTITVNGTASDNVKVSKVEVEVEPGSWQTASGTTLWNTSVTLVPGSNTINASVTDTSGNTKNTSVKVICDIAPPVIYHKNISNATSGEPIPVSANITDDTKVANANLSYRITGEEVWITISMNHIGDNYSATIPASHVTPPVVEYYIEAVDDVSNTAYSPAKAPEKPYSIAVTVINTSIVTIFTTSTINSSEIISGNIIPAHKANVTLRFNSTTCPIFERTTTSAISGCYHFLFPTHEEEKWNVSATWAGDSDTAGNTSKTVSFTVNEPEVNVGYAIIIAGRKDDHVYESIDLSANNTYKVLSNLGFTHERIFYLNPRIEHDADLDGEYDVDKISSRTNVGFAINKWAQDNVSVDVPLLIYMVGHSENDTFFLNGANDNLTASELNNSLDQLTDATECHYITVVYEACHSGSFIDNLSRCGRIIVTSTGKYNDSLFLEGRGGAFSYSFFDNISIGKTIKDAFETASGSADIEKHNKDLNFSDSQTPWLDDNGDGKGNGINNKTKKLEDDGLLAAYKYIGSQIQNKNKIYNYKIRKGTYPEIPAIRLEGV